MRYVFQNANIFATNIRYMNDSEEYINGIKELGEIMNDYNKKKHGDICITKEAQQLAAIQQAENYSISFSMERDLLSQWSMYAKESGVSLGMEFKGNINYEIAEFCGGGERGDRIILKNLFPKKVYYCTKDAMKKKTYKRVKKKILKDLLKLKDIKDIDENAERIWKENIPYIKRYEFNAEGELRLVFTDKNLDKKFRIEYRLDKNVLKPYVDVFCSGGWPICEVIVGPGFNQNQVYESVRHFLNNAEIKVPDLTEIEFQQRCENYLGKYLARNKIKEIWKANKKYVAGEKRDRYYNWNHIKNRMLSVEGRKFNKYIDNHFISVDGIILSKSVIPYIY